jgi:predicted deacylase
MPLSEPWEPLDHVEMGDVIARLLDTLAALESELGSIRAKQDSLITPAHRSAQRLLEDYGRRNRRTSP